MTRPKENYYAFSISLFAAFSIVTQFVSSTFEVDIIKRLFDQFSAEIPNATRAFQWATQSQSTISPLETVNVGIITFALVLCIIFAFRHPKLDGKQGYGNLAIVIIYMGIFTVYSYFAYPVLIQRPLNWAWAIAFAVVAGTSAHLLLLRGRLRRNRREVDTSQFREDDHRWAFLRQSYDVELAEYRNYLHAMIWIGGLMSAVLVFLSIFQYAFSLPPEITFSNEFRFIIIIAVVKVLILLFGLIAGVLHQLASETHDIISLIRSTSKEPLLPQKP